MSPPALGASKEMSERVSAPEVVQRFLSLGLQHLGVGGGQDLQGKKKKDKIHDIWPCEVRASARSSG